MSKAKPVNLEVLPPQSIDLDQRKKRIQVYHENCIAAFSSQMGYALMCGIELNAVKESLPHGQFLKWREENIPQISNGSAGRYMAFATALQNQFPTVGDLTERLQLANGEFSDGDRKEILEAVKEVADGKSLTEMYRELGVVKTPKARREIKSTRKLSAEEKAEAEEHLTHDLIQDAIALLNQLADPVHQARSKKEDREQLIDACVHISSTYRAVGKGEKGRRK